MAGLFDTLGIGASGLMAGQLGSQITGHNIANASTEGFHRQEVLLGSMTPATLGVRVDGIRRASDQLLGRQIGAQRGSLGYADTRAQELLGIERALGPIDETGLSGALDRFFGSWRELTGAPSDTAARTQALARADSLATQVRRAATDLAGAQRDADTQIVAMVAEGNGLIDEVADLNRSIALAEAQGDAALELRDRRELAVNRLADIYGATSFEDDKGHVSVLLGGGVAVVQGVEARHVETVPDATTGLAHLEVSGGARAVLDGRLTSGRIGALIDIRDNELTTRINDLDQWAFDLATSINAQHQLGVGLDGVSGRDLFVAPGAVAGAAANLALDSSLTADQLGVALDPASLPGDTRGAEAMVALESALISGGLTLGHSLSNMITGAGEASRSAGQSFELHEQRMVELDALREARTGVSIEEQMVMLTRYQRAFQAATRVIQTVDSMLDTLIQM